MKTIGIVVLTESQIDGLDAVFAEWRRLGDRSTTFGQLTNDDAGNLVIKLDVLEPETAAKVQRVVSPECAGQLEKVCKRGPFRAVEFK